MSLIGKSFVTRRRISHLHPQVEVLALVRMGPGDGVEGPGKYHGQMAVEQDPAGWVAQTTSHGQMVEINVMGVSTTTGCRLMTLGPRQGTAQAQNIDNGIVLGD